jgi:FMN phosphatase YigB (HAD superfamily)
MTTNKIKQKAYCFDFDETLVKTEAKIHVYRNGAFYRSLTSKEFNFYKHGPHDKFDFKDFKNDEMILNAKRYKMWPVMKNISDAIKTGKSNSTIFILTARSMHVKSAIYEYLKQHGIDIDMKHIITIGDDAGKIDISEEKRKILTKMTKQYNKVVFFDDDPKNIAIAAGIQGIKTRLVEGHVSDYNGLSLTDLIKLKKQYQNIMRELQTKPKRLKRNVFGNEIRPNSRVYKDLKKEYERITSMIAKQYFNKFSPNKLVKEDMGGVSAPMSTPMNTPGMGSAVPPGPGKVGSGDRWDNKINKKPYTQEAKRKRKKKLEEDNINPYDKLGMAMAKKVGAATPFKKKKSKGNQNAMKQQKFEHQIITLDEFVQKINENK